MSARWLVMLVPLALLAIPLALRAPADQPAVGARPLIIITPHNEAIRVEFTRAFRLFAQRELGHDVDIDWRTPGGMSDISKLINEQYHAVAAERLPGFERSFNDPTAATPARVAFLASDLGIGIDVLFGGGEFDHRSMAGKGYLVDAGLLQAMPEVFRDEVIPQTLAGETIYDPLGRYYGTALASFGICYSPDRLRALRSPFLEEPGAPGDQQSPVLQAWDDLAHPALRGHVVMADPTKSGSIATCYVMMLQQQMTRAAVAAGATAVTATPAHLDRGWRQGLTLIKGIAGNARVVTDSASKVPRDVGRGDAVAGMCIDFYGRSEAEWTRHESGRERVVFVSPPGGTSISADPIALLRGAEHRPEALAFMRFVLSVDGQRLWNYRVGEPGGPVRYALRRWSVRRDLFTAEHRAHSSDPLEDPFVLARSFHFQPAWTGPYFDLIRATIKAVVLDPRDELQEAWAAIIQADQPDSPAWREFTWLPYDHHDAASARQQLTDDRNATMRAWTISAQEHYRAATRLARQSRP